VRVGGSALVRAGKNLEHMSDISRDGARRPSAIRASSSSPRNSYFDAISAEGTPQFKQAPFAAWHEAVQNGLQTTNVTEKPIWSATPEPGSISSSVRRTKATLVMDRRFPIVDLEHGTVLASVRSGGKPDTSTRSCRDVQKSPAASCASPPRLT